MYYMAKRNRPKNKFAVEFHERIEWIKALFSPKVPDDISEEQRSLLFGRESVHLILFSIVSFVVSFYAVHVLINLFQVIYLWANSVNFITSLQHVKFLPGDQSVWDETMIFVAFGLPYLASLIIGALVAGWLSSNKKMNWKLRLFFTWFSIHAIMQFAGGAAYATLFFDGFGIAFLWLFTIQPVRIGVTFFVLLLIFATAGRWMRLFFKASPSRGFFRDIGCRYKFLWYMVLIPWFLGSTVIMFFFYPPANRVIFIVLFCYLLLFRPMAGVLPLLDPVRLTKTEKKIFPFKWAALWIVVFLVVMRFVLRLQF